MTLRTRRTIFYALIFIFLTLGTGAALYAQGWRLDIASLTVEKVGGIYVRPAPPGAALSLNGASIPSQGNFFQRGTFINGLFPKSYMLAITASGYEKWEESIPVAPALVSEISYAVLIPREDTLVALDTADFWINGNGTMAIETSAGTILFHGNPVPGTAEVAMTKDGQAILTKTGSSYYWISSAVGAPKNISALLKSKMVDPAHTSVSINEDVSAEIILRAPHSLVLVNPETGEAATIVKTKTNIIANSVASSDSFLAWSVENPATGTSTIILYDRFLKSVNAGTFSLSGKSIALELVNNDTLGVLQENGDFYAVSIPSLDTRKVADDVRSFSFSANGARVALLEHTSMEIISLGTKGDYWRINSPEISSLESIGWYNDNHHLFLSYPGRAVFLEVERGLSPMFFPLRNAQKTAYDASRNMLYFITTGGDLRALQFPAP